MNLVYRNQHGHCGDRDKEKTEQYLIERSGKSEAEVIDN